MARCRFVQPQVVRLYLVDVHRRALADLETKLSKEKDAEKITKLTTDIEDAKGRITVAQEDGDWIDVKRELNAGEARRVFANVVKSMHPGEKATLNPEQVGKTKLAEYIIGWSFTDTEGKSVPFSTDALDNLDTETYIELVAAVDAHDEAAEKAAAERKNGRTPVSTSTAT